MNHNCRKFLRIKNPIKKTNDGPNHFVPWLCQPLAWAACPAKLWARRGGLVQWGYKFFS